MAKTETQETKDVVVRENGASAVTEYVEPQPGMSGEFDDSDRVLPICSLAQPMSQGKGREGVFSFNDGTTADHLDVVVLDIIATRALWGPVELDIKGPVCRSADRQMGLTRFPNAVGAETLPVQLVEEDEQFIICQECHHFADAVTFVKGDKSPRCRYGYTLLLFDRNLDVPFLFFVKGSQVKSVKKRIVSPALTRRARTGKAEPWLTPFLWKSTLIESPGKKFYVAEIMPEPALPNEGCDYYREMSIALSGKASRQTIEEAPDDATAKDEEQAAFA